MKGKAQPAATQGSARLSSAQLGGMSSDAEVRADIEKMCSALLQLLPLQDEREALSLQGITYMSDCVLRFARAAAAA